MNIRNSRFTPGSRSLARTLASGAMLAATLLMATPAHAGFHLWNIREVYTDASGTNQFIEFFTAFGSQQFVGGQQIQVGNVGGTVTHTFTIPSNLPSDTTGHAFLIGTAGTTNFGAPKPDYVLSTNFLFSGGGTITFFGANSGAYTNLPTNGILSRTWASGNATNTPQNFAGTVGQIVIPNLPPVVTLLSPVAGALFATPGPVPVSVTASDPDGTIAMVRVIRDGISAATNTTPPYNFTLSNLTAGVHLIRATATDNQNASVNSTTVSFRVVAPPVLSFQRGSNGPIAFQFNTATGINYIVDRGLPLTNFSPVVTNPGSGGVLQFSETNSVPAQGTYRVRLQ